ncbi:hypothetical protein [Solitalea lacus]|uniref:hypothetical protein n=1 Tax=Solitalea lacus TaxID=2911172 RepID=UPI001EDAE608|nr:hypothetical protein [Solitalea lacus]UKJ06163.1 hypothetical protein L2B55_11495 [Solitalea lacus]
MKRIIILVIALIAFGGIHAKAQVSVNVNIGTPPMWAPYGYSEVRYYYLPDVACYYDVYDARFIYNNGHTWVRVSSLPSRYRDYDLYSGYKVVLDYRGRAPYEYYHSHRSRYPRGYCGPRQITYREYHSHYDDHGYKHKHGKGHKGHGHGHHDD